MLKLILFKMTILDFKDFMKKYNLKNKTKNESELQRIYNYPIYPRDSKVYSDEGFVKIDNGSQGGTHWTCYVVKDNESHHFDTFGGQPDKFLLNQLPKPITYHNYQIQGINSKICGSFFLYFSFLIERKIKVKLYFDKINADKCIWKLFLLTR